MSPDYSNASFIIFRKPVYEIKQDLVRFRYYPAHIGSAIDTSSCPGLTGTIQWPWL
jgi:hypothetical protein